MHVGSILHPPTQAVFETIQARDGSTYSYEVSIDKKTF